MEVQHWQVPCREAAPQRGRSSIQGHTLIVPVLPRLARVVDLPDPEPSSRARGTAGCPLCPAGGAGGTAESTYPL